MQTDKNDMKVEKTVSMYSHAFDDHANVKYWLILYHATHHTCWRGKFRINLRVHFFEILNSPGWKKREISKFQKMNEVNFLQISRINMWFLVNNMWQALKEHTRVRIIQKQSININKFNKHNSITLPLQ